MILRWRYNALNVLTMAMVCVVYQGIADVLYLRRVVYVTYMQHNSIACIHVHYVLENSGGIYCVR